MWVLWLLRHIITRFTTLNLWLADLYAPHGVALAGDGSSLYQCDAVQVRSVTVKHCQQCFNDWT